MELENPLQKSSGLIISNGLVLKVTTTFREKSIDRMMLCNYRARPTSAWMELGTTDWIRKYDKFLCYYDCHTGMVDVLRLKHKYKIEQLTDLPLVTIKKKPKKKPKDGKLKNPKNGRPTEQEIVAAIAELRKQKQKIDLS